MSSARSSLVIFLHGVGSRGDDLAGLASIWRSLLPDTVFAAPDGPDAFDRGGPGFQWFSVSGVTAENRPVRIAAARPAFDATLDRVIAAEGFVGREHRVALVGFSQGSIMALDLLASGRRRLGAIVAFAGRLAAPDPISPADVPLMLLHGTADPVIPHHESEQAADRLAARGLDVTLRLLPDAGCWFPRGTEPVRRIISIEN